MQTLIRSLALFVCLLPAMLFAQSAAVMPTPKQQFLDANGNPLSGGKLYTFVAGTSSLLATYTDASGTVANPNPVVLDSAGRATVFLSTSSAYKFRLESSASVIQWTVDGISAATSSGGGSSGSVTSLFGRTGDVVAVAGDYTVSQITGAASINASNSFSAGTQNFANAAHTLPAKVGAVANLPATCTVGEQYFAVDVAAGSNIYGCTADSPATWTVQGGGGGSGTPGGSTTHVQFNSSGAFAGSANLTWNNTNRLLTVTAVDAASAGIAVADGFIQADAGFLATPGTATAYNAIQAPAGGMTARSFTAGKYVQVGTSAGVPTETASDTFHAGAMYWDSGSSAMQVYNGSAWVSLGGGSGSPGGSTTHVQFNSSGAFAGSANMIWNNASQLLTVTATGAGAAGIAVATGFIQADTGFLATTGTATAYNAIQAAGGGMAAKSFTATKYVQVGTSSGPPALTTSDTFHAGALYWDTGSSAIQVYDGGGWASLGGGTGSPGGSNTHVQYNGTGSFSGSANFIWNNASQLLTVTASSAAAAGIAVATGFIQADKGFLATTGTATAYNVVQAAGGGMAAKSFTATKYVQTGFGSSTPALTTSDTFNPGAMYWNTSLGQEMVYNGSAWVPIGSAAPAGSNTHVQFNNSGALGASANFTFNSGTQLLTVTATSSAAAGIAVATGFIQSDAGFLATTGTATAYNAIQAAGGGMAAKSFTATKYVQVGSGTSAPPATASDSFQPGALYYNTAGAGLSVWNGVSWISVASGGSGVTTAAGTTNQVLVNGGTGAQSGAVTLSLPQSIGTASSPTFASLTASGAFQSQAFGASIAFQTSNFNLQMDGNGNISAAGQMNLTGGGSTYKILGTTFLDSGRNATLASATASGAFQSQASGSSIAFQTSNFNLQMDGNGNISAAGQVNLSGGGSAYKMLGTTVIDSGRNGTFTALTASSAATFNGGINIGAFTNSNIYVGSFGNFYLRTFSGAPSCFGVQDGWAGYDSVNNILYICRGGSATAH